MRTMTYQQRVNTWMDECFRTDVVHSPQERNMRFLEEALELVQALGLSREEAHHLVDYAFDREKGEATQEVGGVLVCLAALCNTADIEMTMAAEQELTRCWVNIDKIRLKHAAKPANVRGK